MMRMTTRVQTTRTTSPSNPDEEESFLAAEINILSWNVIGQNVELGKD